MVMQVPVLAEQQGMMPSLPRTFLDFATWDLYM